MRKNTISIITICTIVLCAISCQKESASGVFRCNTPIDNFLYGVEYDDYDFDACVEYFNHQFIPESGACSEVRKGRFVGRNLDWCINRNASAIIKMNHTDDHFASIGVVGCFSAFNNDLAKSGHFDDVYRYLPFKTEDGVNEYGLYVGVNVVPTGETSFDTSSWQSGLYGHGAVNTNPSSPYRYSVNYIPRILLDRARNVEEAKKIIDSINWTEPKNYPNPGESQSFHWLICDKENSVVLEFMDNKAVYTVADKIDEPSFGTIMTNFSNCLWRNGIIQTHGAGYERWDILHDNYESTQESFVGMQNLMKKVWYSKAYTTPVGTDLWYTEFANDYLSAPELYKNYELADDPLFCAVMDIKRYIWEDRDNWYHDDTSIWFTTHTSVYDIEDKVLHIMVHEGLSGMQGFYEAPFDVHFAKPLEAPVSLK